MGNMVAGRKWYCGVVWMALCVFALAGRNAAWGATPGSIVVKVNDTESADNPIDEQTFMSLADAVNYANNAANGKSDHERGVEITLNGDYDGGGYQILGGSSGEGFNSVALVGSGDERRVIGYQDRDGLDRDSRILEIRNVGIYIDSDGKVVDSSVTISNVEIVNGLIEESGPVAGTYGGAGLLIGNEPGQGLISTISLNDVGLTGNDISLTGVANNGVLAAGGGGYIEGYDWNDYGVNYLGVDVEFIKGTVVALANVDVTDNSIGLTGTASGSQAIGGGLYVKNATSFTFTEGTISGNTSVVNGGGLAAGGGMALIGSGIDTTYNLNAANLTATLNKVKFTENGVTATDAGDGARGGGLYVDSDKGEYTLTITSSGFDSNFANADGTGTDAHGGALYFGRNVTATVGSSTTFTSNSAVATQGGAYGGAIASATGNEVKISGSSVFRGNFAESTDGDAAGGAIFHEGDGALSVGTSGFMGNYSASDNGNAYGGAIAVTGDGDVSISGSYFYRTTVDEDSSDEPVGNFASSVDGEAFGGAVAITGDGDVSISGSYFIRSAGSGDDEEEDGEEGWANYAHSVEKDAYGGAVAHTGTGDLTISSRSVFSNNGAISDNANASGGAIYSASSVSLSGSYVIENEAIAEKGMASGGGMYVARDLTVSASQIGSNTATGLHASGGGVYVGRDLIVDGESASYIYSNTASGELTASGGGAYVEGAIDARAVLAVYDNTAFSESGESKGGGAYVEGGISVDGATYGTTANMYVYNNRAGYTEILDDEGEVVEQIVGSGVAIGGGLYVEGNIETNGGNLSVYDNMVWSTDSDAMGGGLYLDGNAIAQGGYIAVTGNEARSDTGSAFGGGMYMAGSGNWLGNAVVSDNTATGASVFGGGIYAAGKLNLTNVSVTDNTASSNDEDSAYGGGIYMETDGWNDTDDPLALNLAVTDGATSIISGNTADGKASGIHFRGDGNGILNIASEGTFNLLDPVLVDIEGEFTLSVEGDGWFVWGGENVFNAEMGTSLILGDVFDDPENPGQNKLTGKTRLSRDFSATLAYDSSLTIGGVFSFDGQRESIVYGTDIDGNQTIEYKSMFTFTDGGTVTILSGTNIDVDISAELLDGKKDYLLADGIWDLDSQDAAYVSSDGHVNSTVREDENGVWLNTTYTSLYHGLINASDHNTRAAIDSGAMSDPFRELSNEQRALLTSSQSNFDNFQPGWLMNQTLAGMNTAIGGAEAARRYGLGPVRKYAETGRRIQSSRLGYGNYFEEDEERVKTGARFWSGYVGDSDRMDSDGGYYGYKSTRHGFVAGLNYDSGYFGSIGIYGGYTHTRTKSKDIVANVRSDTGHTGLIGRVSPFREIPQLSVSVDAGYTFSSNKGRRGAGSLNTTSNFDQKYYTVGAEGEYMLRAGGAFIAPYLSARYVRVKQDGFTESGAMANRMGDVSGNVFITRLGATFGVEMPTPMGPVTPTANVAWRHQFGDRQFNAGASFLNTGGTAPISYTVKSAKADRDSVDIGVALRTTFNRDGDMPVGVNIGYNLNAGSNQRNHSVYVGLDLSF